MATSPKLARVVEVDTIRVEFVIDDLVKQLLRDYGSVVGAANCNGCSRCSTEADLPQTTGERK